MEMEDEENKIENTNNEREVCEPESYTFNWGKERNNAMVMIRDSTHKPCYCY